MPDSENVQRKRKPAARKKTVSTGNGKKPAAKKTQPRTKKRPSKKKLEGGSIPLPVIEPPVPDQKRDRPVEIPQSEDASSSRSGSLIDVARRAGRTAGRIARIADFAVDSVLVAAKKISRKR